MRTATINTSPFLHRTTRAPSPRRLKFFTVLFALFLVIFLLYRHGSSSSQSSADVGDFYYKTKTALDHDKEDHTKHSAASKEHDHDHHEHAEHGTSDDGELEITKKMAQRLKDAAKEAKDKANAKAPKPDPPSSIIGVGSAAEGSSEKTVGRKKTSEGSQKVVKAQEKETEEDHEVEVELNNILRKAPSKFSALFTLFTILAAKLCSTTTYMSSDSHWIFPRRPFVPNDKSLKANKNIVIIFSKSYCPHSARAKHILLEKYILDPPPHVVELDQHPLGLNLQSRLEQLTGRRTVPNVLVNAVSIGGGDDVAALDEEKKLVSKIKDLAGKKMVEVRLKAGSNREREKEKEKKAPVRGSDGAF